MVDVSGELIKNGLGLYPRVARRAKLDDLLFKRERLQATEANQLKNVEAKMAAVWPPGGADRLVLDFCACLSTTIQVGEDGAKTGDDDDAAAANGATKKEENADEEEERSPTPESHDGENDVTMADEADVKEERESAVVCYSATCR